MITCRETGPRSPRADSERALHTVAAAAVRILYFSADWPACSPSTTGSDSPSCSASESVSDSADLPYGYTRSCSSDTAVSYFSTSLTSAARHLDVLPHSHLSTVWTVWHHFDTSSFCFIASVHRWARRVFRLPASSGLPTACSLAWLLRHRLPHLVTLIQHFRRPRICSSKWRPSRLQFRLQHQQLRQFQL